MYSYLHMKKRKRQAESLRAVIGERGIVGTKDIRQLGVHHETIRRMVQSGEIRRLERGVYAAAEYQLAAEYSLATVATRAPSSVVCLLSALAFHQIGTQMPPEVWIALPRGQRTPRISGLRIRAVRYSGLAFTSGVEERMIDGVPVRVYSPAKTVADCFKNRNKIGLDVALEALRDAWRRRLCTMDALWEYATVCRVAVVMRPYLESLL
jgi:predicted transcriptional regulator of viral defense system